MLREQGLLPHDYTRDAAHIHELDGALHNATVGFLAQTPSALLLNQEDLTKKLSSKTCPAAPENTPIGAAR